jgi:Holliday junction resolvase RusA-like endonuclease
MPSKQNPEYSFVVDGRPIAKQRPRMTRRGKAYTPERTMQAQDRVREAYQGPCYEGPVAVECDFYPSETVITIRPFAHSSKLRGDIDNYLKTVLDGLQPVAFVDDRQVCSVWMEKW